MLKPLGIAFIISLLASLLVAVTLTPVMSSYMLTSERALKRSQKRTSRHAVLQAHLRQGTHLDIGHRKTVLAGSGHPLRRRRHRFQHLLAAALPPFNEAFADHQRRHDAGRIARKSPTAWDGW